MEKVKKIRHFKGAIAKTPVRSHGISRLARMIILLTWKAVKSDHNRKTHICAKVGADEDIWTKFLVTSDCATSSEVDQLHEWGGDFRGSDKVEPVVQEEQDISLEHWVHLFRPRIFFLRKAANLKEFAERFARARPILKFHKGNIATLVVLGWEVQAAHAYVE